MFHFDCGDGHFVPPVTMGPVVLRSIAPGIHAAGGVLDCHLMVDDPVHHFEEFAASGADSVTFHVEVADDPAAVAAEARGHGLGVGVVFNPETTPARAAEAARAAGADIVLCMSIHPGTRGRRSCPRRSAGSAELATLVDVPIQVDGGVGEDNAAALREAGASLFVAGNSIFGDPRARRGVPAPARCGRMSIERALELADAEAGRGYPNPTVGAVVVAADGAAVGEGVTEPAGGRHGEIVALDAAGRRRARARRST